MPSAGLFGSGVLEVAIGVIFLYFLLSTIASSLNELIATALKWRAQNLEFALGNLINDPALLWQVVQHPLIRSMGQRSSETRGQSTTREADKKITLEGRPSYLPARTFALAVMHSLSNPNDDVAALSTTASNTIDIQRIRETAKALADTTAAPAKQLTGQAINALLEECHDPAAAAQALDTLKQRLTEGLKNVAGYDFNKLRIQIEAAVQPDDLRNIIKDLPEPEKTWATAVADSADRQIEIAAYTLDNLRTSIETWFDHGMERAAGAYKRKALQVLAVIAILLVLLTGADSVQFVTRLYVDSALRTQLAAQAGQVGQSPDFTKAVQALEPYFTLFGYSDYPGIGSSLLWYVPLKLGGLAATVFAIMLGGPFWFDVLGKIANVRGSGPKPKSTTSG